MYNKQIINKNITDEDLDFIGYKEAYKDIWGIDLDNPEEVEEFEKNGVMHTISEVW